MYLTKYEKLFPPKVLLLGKPEFRGTFLHNGGKYYWIILATERVQAIAKRDVCTKSEENQSKAATSTAQIHIIYKGT